MADAPRAFAFEGFASDTHGDPLAAPGVTLRARRPEAMLDVRGHAADIEFVRAVSSAFHVELPGVANTARGTDALRALWLGPDECLIVSAAALSPDAPAKLPNGTLVDVSHARAVLRLSGPDARDALAKGCSLDLDPRRFPLDACAQTAIAKINVILDHVQPDVFDLYCPRSYAGSFWHWLTEAAAEYGCNIDSAAHSLS